MKSKSCLVAEINARLCHSLFHWKQKENQFMGYSLWLLWIDSVRRIKGCYSIVWDEKFRKNLRMYFHFICIQMTQVEKNWKVFFGNADKLLWMRALTNWQAIHFHHCSVFIFNHNHKIVFRNDTPFKFVNWFENLPICLADRMQMSELRTQFVSFGLVNPAWIRCHLRHL